LGGGRPPNATRGGFATAAASLAALPRAYAASAALNKAASADATRAAATTALASFAPVDVRLRVFGIAGATPGPGPRVAAAEVTVVNG
tara:strand:+ start:1433 stop:1696 length:264 start_codon:yes stop_codon:yes gene_type:complete